MAGIHALLPRGGRGLVLLCASLAFYACSSLYDLVLMLALCSLNYGVALALSRPWPQRRRTWLFAAGVAANLATLLAFKYAPGFTGEMLARLCGWDDQSAGAIRLILPLGLSYFTFQMVGCLTDAYRQTWKLNQGYATFVLFGFFFPQISSGPIPRADRLLPQLADGGHPTAHDRLAGVRLIAYGFFKKYVVANRLAPYVSILFAVPPDMGTVPVLLACCFNVLQLYADFSGYVDIAIGSARFFGIRLDPNFDHPFASSSVTEFWRHWHMTLSFWLRDYVYLPLLIRIRALGKSGVVLALLITFSIIGVWHGAKWTYLVFGICQGVAMSAEFLTKSWRTRWQRGWPPWTAAWAGRLYLLSVFTLSSVFFRSADLSQAANVFGRLVQCKWSGMFGIPTEVKPFFVFLDCLAVAIWVGMARLHRKSSDDSTPWFALLCALLIVFLGHLGSLHFIYAAF